MNGTRTSPAVFLRRLPPLAAGIAVLALCLSLNAGGASADMNIYSGGGFTLDAALTLGAGTFRGDGTRISANPSWLEFYAEPELRFSYYNTGLGEFYANIGGIGAATLGDGDANLSSTTSGNPASVAFENANVGWRSGRLFGDLNTDVLDIGIGRQAFVVGDGFLIGDGTFDAGRRADYYIGPRVAFDGIGVVRVNTEPVRGDLFVLRTSTDQHVTRGLDQPQTDFAGGNLEWFESKKGEDGRAKYDSRLRYAGIMGMHVYRADNNDCFSIMNCSDGPAGITGNANRDGLNVVSARVGGSLIPMAEDFTFYGEYAFQWNDEVGRRTRANAWYVEPGWTFSNLKYTPRIFYRYSHFSGDSDPDDNTKRSFDPLFYSSGRGYGTWFLGEIAGQYFLFNSNDDVHQVGVSVNPLDELKLSAFYYRFSYAEPKQLGIEASHAMDEVDVVAEWTVNDRLSVQGVIGAARPGIGAKQFLSGATAGLDGAPTDFDRTWTLFEATATYKF